MSVLMVLFCNIFTTWRAAYTFNYLRWLLMAWFIKCFRTKLKMYVITRCCPWGLDHHEDIEICFQDEATALQALQAQNVQGVEAIKFEPRDRRHFRKVINNIYVKNIPVEKTDVVSSEMDITRSRAFVDTAEKIDSDRKVCARQKVTPRSIQRL